MIDYMLSVAIFYVGFMHVYSVYFLEFSYFLSLCLYFYNFYLAIEEASIVMVRKVKVMEKMDISLIG